LKALKNHESFEFRYDNGAWTINGSPFDPDVIGKIVRQGPPAGPAPDDGMVWTLRNQDTSNWSHPIHIHLEEFQILLRNGKAPSPVEQNKKDVLILKPNEEVQIFLRFRDFLGRYPIHCHNVVHEDMMMMMRFDIVGT